jgi:hypothetical protein
LHGLIDREDLMLVRELSDRRGGRFWGRPLTDPGTASLDQIRTIRGEKVVEHP